MEQTKKVTKMALTFTDPEVLKILTELQFRFPNQVSRSVGYHLKKNGIGDIFNMCIDYQVDLKEKQKAAQRAAYQKNKQSIKDKTILKRIELTHGKTFIIDNIGT